MSSRPDSLPLREGGGKRSNGVSSRPALARKRREDPTGAGSSIPVGFFRTDWAHGRLVPAAPWKRGRVVLTAASPEQAALYDRQLSRARRLGRFPASTAALAVPDPDAARIGFGAATLHPVASLASKKEIAEFLLEANGSSADDIPLELVIRFMTRKHILLLHAGGDSKRVPWVNPMGKAFQPLPYLAGDNPNGPVPCSSITFSWSHPGQGKLSSIKVGSSQTMIEELITSRKEASYHFGN